MHRSRAAGGTLFCRCSTGADDPALSIRETASILTERQSPTQQNSSCPTLPRRLRGGCFVVFDTSSSHGSARLGSVLRGHDRGQMVRLVGYGAVHGCKDGVRCPVGDIRDRLACYLVTIICNCVRCTFCPSPCESQWLRCQRFTASMRDWSFEIRAARSAVLFTRAASSARSRAMRPCRYRFWASSSLYSCHENRHASIQLTALVMPLNCP